MSDAGTLGRQSLLNGLLLWRLTLSCLLSAPRPCQGRDGEPSGPGLRLFGPAARSPAAPRGSGTGHPSAQLPAKRPAEAQQPRRG